MRRRSLYTASSRGVGTLRSRPISMIEPTTRLDAVYSDLLRVVASHG